MSIITDPDEGLTMPEIVKLRGYEIENHSVTTDDGYILGLFRIPSNNSKPVLLMHGLLDSSYAYVCQSRNQSLGYILADRGYDVWFGNVRGNTWSKSHIILTTDDPEYWNFSIDDHAMFDVPAIINYILNVTQKEKLAYIGHSQGTTIAFASTNLVPEIVNKISLFIGLAPVFIVKTITSITMRILADIYADKIIYDLVGIGEFLPSSQFIKFIGKNSCSISPHGCDLFLEIICGYSRNINETRIDIYVLQTPAGTSTKNIVQWAQNIRNDKTSFIMYDYGNNEINQMHYGKNRPPVYNISDFTIPSAIFYGSNDELADLNDIEYLANNLPNLIFKKKIENFSHLDFTWGKNANEFVYLDIIKILQNTTF
jgi:pimeloyl-ACP methyl ester carboxylesterase